MSENYYQKTVTTAINIRQTFKQSYTLCLAIISGVIKMTSQPILLGALFQSPRLPALVFFVLIPHSQAF